MSVKAPWLGDCPLAFALAAGFAASVVGCFLASAAAAPSDTGTRLAVLALVLAVYAAAVPNLSAAVLSAGIAWSFFLGFVIDRDGEVRWHGTADLVRLGVLIVAVLAGSAWWRVSAAINPTSEEENRSHG
jgi:hypothetical protein